MGRKREHCVTERDNTALKKRCVDVDIDYSDVSSPSQDESKLYKACQNNQIRIFSPHHLIGLMYRLDLSMLCSARHLTYEHEYPSLLLAFEDSEFDKFNSIVLCNKNKSIHIQIEYVDKYYTDNVISYAKLFAKEKRSFSINNYFDSFVKYILSKSISLSNEIEYLIVYTNASLDLTEENIFKKGRFKHFYPFKFDSIDMEKCDILKDFLLINNNLQGRGFYRFVQDKMTREELRKRLEFSPATQKVIKDRELSQELVMEMKNSFLDKLLFAANQPDREELNMIVKGEIEKNNQIHDCTTLRNRILCDLTAPERDGKLKQYISTVMYEFSVLMSFLLDLCLDKNMLFVGYEGKNYGKCNYITINYKDKLMYVKTINANDNITYSRLFLSKKQGQKTTFSIDEYFHIFLENLGKDMEYFVIYTNVSLDLTEENTFKKVRSKDFYPLKFDCIDIREKRFKILRRCSCVSETSLYQFAQDDKTREKLLSLMKLPTYLCKQKEEGRISNYDEQKMKEFFLDKLIFAVDQPCREKLNYIMKDNMINNTKSNGTPYDFEQLHEIALRSSESREFSHMTKKIMEEVYEKMKKFTFSHRKKIYENIEEEVKFTKSVVNREGTSEFYKFLDYLIKGDGRRYLVVLKRRGINLRNMSSILHVSGSGAERAFEELYDLWFDAEGNKRKLLKILEKKGINLSNMSSILGGSGGNAARAFKELYHLWFDEEGNKTKYLKNLEKDGINLSKMSSILSGSGARAAEAFKDLYDLWFDVRGIKTVYLKNLERKGINLTTISSILNVAGANAARAFKDLYAIWFDQEGNETQCLKTLRNEEINLANMFSVLHGAGSNAVKAFEELYNLWFDTEGNRTQYLINLEDEGINLFNVSSILHGAGANAAKAFKELYNAFIDKLGNKTRHLRHFSEEKDGGKSFTMHNLSGMLSRARTHARDAFESLHNVCFDDDGARTELLEDFYNAGFRPSNLSCILCGSGAHVSSNLKKLHSVCFDKKRKMTKLMNDFFNAGFRPSDLCSTLSGAVDRLKEFHDFCFVKETKKYLNNFLNEKGGFRPRNLSKILHGTKDNVCFALKDFHDVCFDEAGNKTQLLDDFYSVGFKPSNLSNVLSMSGNNATSILRNFHKSCFNQEKYIHRFLEEEEMFTPRVISKILYGVGPNVCHIFQKLHDLCFDKAGNKTKYLKYLIETNLPERIPDILYGEVR